MNRPAHSHTPENQGSWAFSNRSVQWGCFVADVIAAAGVEHAFISPGSRSAPLALGFARRLGGNAVSVIDERTAGFVALGAAKASGKPSVLVCTSGTAASHYYPALIEARMSEVPMIVCTADRPPELRDCFSGQTIDQVKLFGHYPLWQHEFGLAEPTEDAFRYLRQMIIYGYDRACGVGKGPVHLNFPFRDPLDPQVVAGDTIDPGCYRRLLDGVVANPPAGRTVHRSQLRRVIDSMLTARRGVIIVGPSQPVDADGFANAVGSLAEALGWPVLADGLTPLRSRRKRVGSSLVTGYDALLRDDAFFNGSLPDAVLSIGPLPASKVLRRWLAEPSIQTWVLGDTDANWDGLHRNCVAVRCGVDEFASAVKVTPRENRQTADAGYSRGWQQGEAAVNRARGNVISGSESMSEARIVYTLVQNLPHGASLFVGNSMPVRDLEMMSPPADNAVRVFCNRGANGIDGNLATAIGIAATGAQTYCLLGDVACLHDVGSLVNRPKVAVNLTIVVINNGGGGIFKYLPIHSTGAVFDEFFLTPGQADLATLCSAAGIDYERVSDLTSLASRIGSEAEGLRLVELCVSADDSMHCRAQYHSAVAQELKRV